MLINGHLGDIEMRSSLKLVTMMLVGSAVAPAFGELSFCNETESEVQLALSRPTASGSRIEQGWFKLPPGECRDVIKTPLKYRKYFYYARQDSGSVWRGKEEDEVGCIVRGSQFRIEEDTCPSGSTPVNFRTIDTGGEDAYTVRFVKAKRTSATVADFQTSKAKSKACEILQSNLDKPRLRPQPIIIARYTDLLTPPQTRTECTNVYDTGVPDLATCATEYDPCASELSGPFGTWTCLPGTTTRCSNIKACNTWTTDKKTMECDLIFQIRLPNYIERPLSDFIDSSYDVIQSSRQMAATSLPLECAPAAASVANGDITQAVAQQITRELQDKVSQAIQREAEQWFREVALKAIVASIPSGGTGGAAVMGSELGQFVYRAHRVLKPIIEVANDTKEFAEDLGFNTRCGWSDWHRF